MMYPFLTLNDDTEITHSEMNSEGIVKVYIEKPDEKDGFHYATIFLPSYDRGEVFKFTESEMDDYTDIIRHSQKCILRFHISEGKPNKNATKVWMLEDGTCRVVHNNSKLQIENKLSIN